MKKLILALLASLALLVPLRAQEVTVDVLAHSVALLYAQTDDGGLQMRCTATAFDKVHGGYKFVSAAHCVGEDDAAAKKAADPANIPFYISFDDKSPKVFYEASPLAVGYQHKGDDFSVFEVKVDGLDWPVISLGDEKDAKVGDEVYNVASPLGLGKQVFKGAITSLYLDRPVVEGDINWKGAMLLSINVGPGSSGSAVIDKGKIIGFLVGTVQSGGTPNVITIPVSRFKTFMKAKNDGTYPN